MKLKNVLPTAVGAFLAATVVALVMREMRQPGATPPSVEGLPNAVVVFCFHGAHPSENAEKVRKWMHELLETSFADDMKAGRLVWRDVNTEKPENRSYIAKYQLQTAGIVIDDGRSGNSRTAINYCQKALALVEDKEKFVNYFRQAIAQALK